MRVGFSTAFGFKRVPIEQLDELTLPFNHT